ncbi:MAG: cytochrome b/b6 domain-containing protein [Syntrophales bacterium]|jgi:thiosulfate reductase cytochrome b subunit
MMRIYLHPLPLRIWHWLNAFIVIMLIVTGLYLRLHGIAALKPHDPVLLWHKGMGLAMIIATLFWFIYNISSGNLRRHYGIKSRDIHGIFVQARFYLYSIFGGGENPFQASAADKYNPLQKIAYDAVMLIFLPVQALTGLLFMDIPPLRDYLLSVNLFGLLGAMHLIFAYLLVLYLIVHLYMATLGETVFSHTKAMIVGYEEQGHGIKGEETNPI